MVFPNIVSLLATNKSTFFLEIGKPKNTWKAPGHLSHRLPTLKNYLFLLPGAWLFALKGQAAFPAWLLSRMRTPWCFSTLHIFSLILICCSFCGKHNKTKMGRRSISTTKSGKFMNPTDQASKTLSYSFIMILLASSILCLFIWTFIYICSYAKLYSFHLNCGFFIDREGSKKARIEEGLYRFVRLCTEARMVRYWCNN